MLYGSLSGGTSGKELAWQGKICGFDPVLEDPLEEGMATHTSILFFFFLIGG